MSGFAIFRKESVRIKLPRIGKVNRIPMQVVYGDDHSSSSRKQQLFIFLEPKKNYIKTRIVTDMQPPIPIFYLISAKFLASSERQKRPEISLMFRNNSAPNTSNPMRPLLRLSFPPGIYLGRWKFHLLLLGMLSVTYNLYLSAVLHVNSF